MIKFINAWTDADKAIVLDAIKLFSEMLSRYTGTSPEDAFSCVMRDINFKLSPSIKYHGYAKGNTITLKPGFVELRLVLHELAHIFSNRFEYRKRPQYLLGRYGIPLPNSRKLVTGPYIGGYSRGMGRYAQVNGFISDTIQHKKSQVNSAFEDFADMLMNFIFGIESFADNDAGHAIYYWMDEHMREWLLPCTIQK